MNDMELIYIKTIFEEKSLTKAAEKLFITQPSLSKSLSRIEKVLGIKLFKRTTSGIEPTYAGEKYYRMAQDILKIYNEFEVEISDINNLKKGRITIGITPQLATFILPTVLPIFKERFPNIEVFTQEMSSGEIETSLSRGELDFAIMFLSPFHIKDSTFNIDFKLLFKDSFLLVTEVDHPLDKYAKPDKNSIYSRIDLKLFASEPFIITEKGMRIREVSDLILQKANINPEIALTTRSFETARRLASQGCGVTFIPKTYIDIFPSICSPNYYTLDERYTPYWKLSIAVQKGAHLSNADSKFIEIIKENFKEK